MNGRIVIGYLDPETAVGTTREDVVEARRAAHEARWQQVTAKHQLMTAKTQAHAISSRLEATEGEVRRQWEAQQAPGEPVSLDPTKL